MLHPVSPPIIQEFNLFDSAFISSSLFAAGIFPSPGCCGPPPRLTLKAWDAWWASLLVPCEVGSLFSLCIGWSEVSASLDCWATLSVRFEGAFSSVGW
eukprot:c54589_g1_i1 orf=14-307(-)